MNSLKYNKDYNNRHHVEAMSNYAYNNSKKDKNLAQFIYDNYNHMDDEQLKYIATKCMSGRKIRKEILEYELKYYEPNPKSMTLDEFIKEAKIILKRYQSKAGGFYIEDNEWIVHNSDSVDYNVKGNEVLFENSVDKQDAFDNETINFMKRLVNRLNLIAKDIIVTQQQSEPEDGIIWLQIWCHHTNMSNNKPQISL